MISFIGCAENNSPSPGRCSRQTRLDQNYIHQYTKHVPYRTKHLELQVNDFCSIKKRSSWTVDIRYRLINPYEKCPGNGKTEDTLHQKFREWRTTNDLPESVATKTQRSSRYRQMMLCDMSFDTTVHRSRDQFRRSQGFNSGVPCVII